MTLARAHSTGLVGMCLVLSALLNIGGCASAKNRADDQRNMALTKATENYRKLIRWGYFEEASRYFRTRNDELPAPDLANFAPWTVTGYDMGEVRAGDTANEARILARIDFYRKDTRIVSKVRDEQLWWYDTTQKSWFLGTPMPDFAKAAQHPR